MNNQRKHTHTPGPWFVESGPNRTASGLPADWIVTCPGGTIASLIDGDADRPRFERDKNALLIAAAPELLAAIRRLAEFTCTARECMCEDDPSRPCPPCEARAAIEKAGG